MTIEAEILEQEKWLCTKVDPEEFFIKDKGRTLKKIKLLCSICEKQNECLNIALSNKINYGIWGGKNPVERIKLRKKGVNNVIK